MSQEKYSVWAIWHPKNGFVVPYSLGPFVSPDLDYVAERVKILNREDGTNNRNGWRAVKAELAKVPA